MTAGCCASNSWGSSRRGTCSRRWRARHLAEGCDAEFGVLVDVREFGASGNALAALGEWETFLRVAGATAVVRVGDDHAVGGADHRATSVEEAERLLS